MRALVTGSSPGIGGACCERLVADALARGEEARIAAAEVRETPEVRDLADRLRAKGAEVAIVTGDLRAPETPARMVAETVDALGGLDAVVSNAGIVDPAPMAELSLEQWDRVMDVNVRATFLLAKAAYPELKRAGGGGIVAVASMSGMYAHTRLGAYTPSKAALIALCRVLAQEWAGDGIRVNTVSPGMIRTPFTANVYQNNEIAQARADIIPWGRVGMPSDIANTVAFLLGPDAQYMTGQNLLVDGGFTDSLLSKIPGVPAKN
jgi:NAD(P)-dependent dehydrogenase (short-subunit alcohol dehydrogenase family)